MPSGFNLKFKHVKLLEWISLYLWAKTFKIVENMCAMLVNLVKQASTMEGVC